MKYFGLLLFALLLAYGSEWAPYYVELFSNNQLSVIGRLDQNKEKCAENSTIHGKCTDAYRIPKSKLTNFTKDSALGIGIIIAASKIKCSDSSLESYYGDLRNPGSISDIIHTYQVYKKSDFPCENDILVEAWAPSYFRRHGFTGSPAVVGHTNYVDRVKRLTEFFTKELRIIIALLFFGIFGFNYLLNFVSSSSLRVTPFENYTYSWLLFMILSSGLAQLFLPIVSEHLFFIRASNFFSLVAHLGPGILLMADSHRLPNPMISLSRFLTGPIRSFRRLEPLHIGIAFLCSTPYFGLSLGPLAVLFATLFIYSGYRQSNILLLIYGLALGIDGVKLFNLPYTPHSYVTSIFVALTIAQATFFRVKKGARLAKTLRWARSVISDSVGTINPSKIVCDFAQQFEIPQITIIEPQKHGKCQITIYKRRFDEWNSEILYRSQLPPMFAHALSTRESLWHVEENSLYATNLRKGGERPQNYHNRFFSVLPLLKDSYPIGAVAFTGYDEIFATDEDYQLEMTATAELILPQLSNLITNQVIAEREDWAFACAKVIDSLEKIIYSNNNKTEVLQAATEKISALLGTNVILGQVLENTQQLKIEGIAGYDNTVKEKYLSSTFYAVPHNEQGPMPLAINRQKIVTIPDVGWLNSVLHPSTLDVFELAKTKSCAALPIFVNTGLESRGEIEERRVWGVLWLESTELGFFTPHQERGLKSITATIENLINYAEQDKKRRRIHDVLAGFVPNRVLNKISEGKSPREEQIGYLLMVDLRDSTKIARLVGSDGWIDFVDQITPSLEELAKDFHYQLQTVIWDAFYFTNGIEKSNDEIANAVRFTEAVSTFVNKAFEIYFEDISLAPHVNRTRTCLCHGDITRDIRAGMNDSWTITGNAMAIISKLEQTCKKLQGWLFVSESSFRTRPGQDWEQIHSKIPGTEDEILRLDKPFKEISLPSNFHQSIKSIKYKKTKVA